MAKKEKVIIGRSDMVDLPDFGIENIRAKIDTGAYRSSLHCSNIYEEGGKLKFTPLTGETEHEVTFDTWEIKTVKSSNGEAQERYVIQTRMILFGRVLKTTLSLTDRSEMRNPLLIGRKLLNGKFIVDVSKKNLSFEAKSVSS